MLLGSDTLSNMTRLDSSDDEPAAYPIDRLLQESLELTGSGIRNTADLSSALADSSIYDTSIFTEIKSFGNTLAGRRRRKRDREGEALFGHDIGELDGEDWNTEKYVERLAMQQLGGDVGGKRDFRLGGCYDADTMLGALDGAERIVLSLKKLASIRCNEAVGKLRECTQRWQKEKIGAATVVQQTSERDENLRESIAKNEEELNELTTPLAKLVAERKNLLDARDFLNLMNGHEFPMDRAAELLALATKSECFHSLPSHDQSNLEETTEELWSTILEHLGDGSPERLEKGLMTSAFAAARFLGREQALVTILINQLPVFKSSLIMGSNPSQTSTDDVDASLAVEPLKMARWDCFDSFRSALSVASTIPPQKDQFLAKLSTKLVMERLVPVARNILSGLECGMNGSQLVHSDEKREGTPDTLVMRRRRFLIALAETMYMMNEVCQTLSMQCITENMKGEKDKHSGLSSADSSHSLIECSSSGMENFIASFPEVERSWLEEASGECFGDISTIEMQGSRLVPGSSSHVEANLRYRLLFLRVLDQLELMTNNAIGRAQESLRRCAMVLKPNDLHANALEKNDVHKRANRTEGSDTGQSSSPTRRSRKPRVELVMKELGEALVMGYLAAVETLLQGAVHLVPQSVGSAGEKGELWTGNNSPLVTYSKVLTCVSLSSEKIDLFLRMLEVEEISVLDEKTSRIDEMIKTHFSSALRRELRKDLRSSLQDLARDADAGLDSACAAVGPYLRAILSRGNFGKQAAGFLVSKSLHEDEADRALDQDPIAFFLSSQIESLSSIVRGHHLTDILEQFASHIRNIALDYWADPSSSLSQTAKADAEIIYRCFADYPEAQKIVSPLQYAASLMDEPASNLLFLLTKVGEIQLSHEMARKLLQKRKDVKTAGETQKAIMALSSAPGVESR